MYPASRQGKRETLQGYRSVAAAKLRVHIVGDQARLEPAGVAQGVGGVPRHVQVLGHHKFQAANPHVAAGRAVVGGDRQGLHASLVFVPVAVHLGQNDGQSHPFARADVFDGGAQLQNAPLGFQVHIAQVYTDGVGAPGYGQVHGRGAHFGAHHPVAFHRDSGGGEGHLVSLRVPVGDGLVDQLCAGRLRHMANGELQNGAFTGSCPQLGDGPAQGAGVQRECRALGGGQNVHQDKVRHKALVDDNVCGAGVGDVGCQVREQLLQVGGIWGDRHMGAVGIGGLFV